MQRPRDQIVADLRLLQGLALGLLLGLPVWALFALAFHRLAAALCQGT